MKIVGFNLHKITVERKEKIEGELKIDQNIDIKEIAKEDISISKDEALKIKFAFSVNYSNDFAKLEFEGYLITLPEKEELKQILKEWKDKKIPPEIRMPLFNFIMSKCNIKALNLEDEMGLPLHIPMPRIAPQPKKE